MVEFLTSLLTLAFSLGLLGQPGLTAKEIVARFEEQIAHVEAPTPIPSPLPHAVNVSDGNGPGFVQPEVNGEPADPDTDKVAVFNTSSGKTIGGVAAVAEEKAEPLVDCSDPSVSEDCDGTVGPASPPDPLPTPPPTPSPSPNPAPSPLPSPVPSPIPLPSPLPKPPFDCDPPPPFPNGHFDPLHPLPCPQI